MAPLGHQYTSPTVLARYDQPATLQDAAVTAARHAVRRTPEEAAHHVELADSLDQLGNWREALRWYHSAHLLDPNWPEPQLGTAHAHLRLGAVAAATEILEALYARTGGAARVGDRLALALTAAAEGIPTIREDDAYFITRRSEVRRMAPLLARAARVTADTDLSYRIMRIQLYIRRCQRRELTVHPMGAGLVRRLSAALVLVAAGGLAGAGYIYSSATPVAVVAATLLLAGAGAAGRNLLVPRWRLNQWAFERQPQRVTRPSPEQPQILDPASPQQW